MTTGTGQPLFTAIVLAADRESDNPVAQAAGVRCKTLAPVGGVPMLLRVLDALSSAGSVDDRVLCGPPQPIMEQTPQLEALVASNKVRWFKNYDTPSKSTHHVLQSLAMETPVLLTTGDHALLNPKIIDHFCAESLVSGCDIVAALALHQKVTAAFPETQRTTYNLGGTAYCSCNLFAFMTPRARSAAEFWCSVESQRKNPMRIIQTFGWITLMRYLVGRLTLTQALERASKRLGFKVGVVIMPFPEAAIDVDTIGDWQFVKRIAATNSQGYSLE